MRKHYSLDYSIERDTDRCAAIYQILDQLESDPNPTDLEQMASYILYGKDEEGVNAKQRGEVTDDNKRYGSFKTMEEKVLSLDEILENPMADQQALENAHKRSVYTKPKPQIVKPKYDKKTGALISIGDADIPGMVQLWDNIEKMEHTVAVNEGKIPPQPTDYLVKDNYRLYQMKHWLIDLRRHQYYLKDVYKPTLHFTSIAHPKPQYVDWDSDCFYWTSYEDWERKVNSSLLHSVSKNIGDYETRVNERGETEVKWVVRRHIFDWTNPIHVKYLIQYYDLIYDTFKDKLDTYGRTFIFDFERYVEMANLSEVRRYILECKVSRVSYAQIVEFLQKYYNLNYTENYLCTILAKEIPEKIALAAKKWELIVETPPQDQKKCSACGRILPRHKLFFVCNRSRKDGFSASCKDCERRARIVKGGQSEIDQRNKESKVHKVQTRKT